MLVARELKEHEQSCERFVPKSLPRWSCYTKNVYVYSNIYIYIGTAVAITLATGVPAYTIYSDEYMSDYL